MHDKRFLFFFIIKTLKLGLRKPYTHNVRVSKMASHPHHLGGGAVV